MKAVAMKRSRSKYASPVKSSSQHSSPVKTTSKAASPKKHTSPSPKKRKAGSDAASLKKRKGGSRARKIASPKKRTSRRLNVTKSVSKSSNNSQQAQRDDDAQEEKNLTGGLKLLKRGIVTMAQEAFVVPKKLRKSVIASAATKWRDFKSRLHLCPQKNLRNSVDTSTRSRQDKDGKFLDVAVEEAVERIVNLQKMEAEGKFKSQGMKDVLTEALGNPEHRGRVRGDGGNVKPETYFDLPRRQRGRKKVSEEERESLFAKEKAKWEEEMKKKQAEVLAEAEAKWEKKFAMLEAKLEGKLLASESPQTVTAVNNDVGSRQGSCSRPWERGNHPGCQAVKKRLVLGGCINGKDAAEEELQPADGKEVVLENEQPPDGRDGSILEDVSAPKESTNAEGVQKGQLDCKLAVDTMENIVAFGRIVDGDLDPNKQTIHGVPLGAENVRVSIVVPIIGHHLLPYPIKDEIMTVKDALGFIVAWPRNLVIEAAIDMEVVLNCF
ncbi:hypothetical protein ACLB2K_073088 [Fragaria x ananassa]